MRKLWIIPAAAMMVISLSSFGVAAQGPGPAGVGAGEAKESSQASHSLNPVKWVKKDSNNKSEKAKKTEAAKQSSHTSHSLNPIKWIKKDSNTENQKSKKTKDQKPSAKPATPETPATAPTA
ncbi:MAG TPA: hypothetical protein VGT24_08985 [Candidatus Acidoferrales bacterium]|nr:hypothetical protein [Candidatus Acidoferrales bacterium]